MIELARRAIACKHWRWLPGMLTADGARLLFENRVCVLLAQPWAEVEICRHTLDCTGALPDLTDPATLGALLALVREAWGDPLMQAMNAGGGWVGFRPAPIWTDKEGCYETEAEALVAALEAAP